MGESEYTWNEFKGGISEDIGKMIRGIKKEREGLKKFFKL